MDIGTQRRTVYIEPVEEPESSPVNEPSPAIAPPPIHIRRSNPNPVVEGPWTAGGTGSRMGSTRSSGIELGTTRSASVKLGCTRSLKGVA
jgi:hypothetical protein